MRPIMSYEVCARLRNISLCTVQMMRTWENRCSGLVARRWAGRSLDPVARHPYLR